VRKLSIMTAVVHLHILGVLLCSLFTSYLDPAYIVLSLPAALQEVAHIKREETVLVTAAAGGTGQFAVQVGPK
jgi:NADPH:quinone reductase-like Zn-dependent oxidoreductase